VRKKNKDTIAIVTLGCSKNTVDSEILLRQIETNNLLLTDDPDAADIVIVNTCGFIDTAKEESVRTILQAARRKRQGLLKTLYVAGCLSERYRETLAAEIPEVDRFFGVTDFKCVIEELGGDFRKELLGERHLTTPSHFAYLKISEGCDNPCSFCSIPIMRGGHVSKPLEDIVREAEFLSAQGVKELVLIGQDTTYYGLDLYGSRRLGDLLARLARVDGIRWIRLMYAYPAHFPLDVLDVIRDHPAICSYIDMPVQHIDDGVLRSMRRGVTRRATTELIGRMRETIPGLTLRTTLIIGYPEETDSAFAELMDFVGETQFDRLGVFPYSLEDGTAAESLGDPIPSHVKDERLQAVMSLQAGISLIKNREKIGTTVTAIIDRIDADYAVGRTAADAPEVDNEVLIDCGDTPRNALIGTFADVTIDEASEFDLIGTLRR
jgi:ribosomal protein S12 methylthiotransferase